MDRVIAENHLPRVEDGLDPLSVAVFRAFRATFHLHRQLMVKALAEKATHPGQAMCLRLIDEQDGISQRDLAEALHLSRPRVTGMLQELEKSGHVTRRSDELDQRLTRVYLTSEGRGLALELGAVFADCISRTIGALPEDDRRTLERLLEAVGENTAAALEHGTQGPGR